MKKLIFGFGFIFIGVFGLVITLVGSMLMPAQTTNLAIKVLLMFLLLLFPSLTIFGAVKLSQGLHIID